MQSIDLKRSNAVYIFRSFMHSPKSLKEISDETETAVITIKKIVYKLIDENIASKCQIKVKSIGRPHLYLSPNPQNHTLLIKRTTKQFVFFTINTLGQCRKIKTIPNDECYSEDLTLEFAFNILKRDKMFKFCQGAYLIGREIENYKEIDGISKSSTFQLIAKSLADDESTIYLEFGNQKAVINHGKIKEISRTKEDVFDIIDVDQDYTFNDLDEEKAITEALRILTLKSLEEKVAQLFS